MVCPVEPPNDQTSEHAPAGQCSVPVAQLRKRSVAVTGAAGSLGANLVAFLEEDPRIGRVVAIDTDLPRATGNKTRAYPADLTQPTTEARLSEIFAAEHVDAIAHLAFLASPSHAAAWAHELESVGTMHVLIAARHAHVRKVVLGSQTLLYGAHPSNANYLSEDKPLRASRKEPFFADKIEAEEELARFAKRSPGAVCTVLRMAPILGPTVSSYLTRYLSRRLVPTMMGFDPLLQFLHEVDAVAALKLALDRDRPGTFNIVADGVLPLSTVIKLAGRMALPIPDPLARSMTSLLWLAELVETPASFLRYLHYVCVADGRRANDEMGFRPAYTTREALLDFASAQRLRDVRLLQESVR